MEKRRVDELHGCGCTRRHRCGSGLGRGHGPWSGRELGSRCWGANWSGSGSGSGYGLVESTIVRILLLLQRLLRSAAGVELRVLLAVSGVDVSHVLLMIWVVLIAVGIVARVLLLLRVR